MDGDISVDLGHGRKIWLTEVSRKTFEDQRPALLEHDSGLFIVLEDVAKGSFEILAKAASMSSGLALLELVSDVLRRDPSRRPMLTLVKA